MPSLKDLRTRIDSVKSTQKITSAMKMVAAAKLRRAQEQAENARPYADRLEKVLQSLAVDSELKHPLLSGTGRNDIHLIVIMTSDRGLCGGFNSSLIKLLRHTVEKLESQGKETKIICIGQKGRDAIRARYGKKVVRFVRDIAKPSLNYKKAYEVSEMVQEMLSHEEFDTCSILYSRFQSAIVQTPTLEQIIPLNIVSNDNEHKESDVQYIYEPSESKIVKTLLPKNLSIQIYKAMLENAASEHGARMTAMDNATRNAGDMIKEITLQYNRSRQAHITRELIEIISGAEAL